MELLILLSAILFLFLGHVLKVKRWQQFVEIYEQPPRRRLYSSLGMGYIVNFIVPFRIGDIVRAVYAGKGLKNGTGFALATVILDRYLDFLVVGLIFLTFSITGFYTNDIKSTTQFYLIVTSVLIVLSIAAFTWAEYLKRVASIFCSIFNTKIQSGLLFFLWACISTFKDVMKVNKRKLLFYTIVMWASYLFSYYLFAKFWTISYDEKIVLADIFNQLFSASSIDISTLKSAVFSFNNGHSGSLVRLVYFLTPLIGLILISQLPLYFSKVLYKYEKIDKGNYIALLPFEDEIDKLTFFDTYFSSTRKEFLDKFIEINRDVSILKNNSGGSNAETLLCMNNDSTFYRKFAIGDNAEKLQSQVLWIQRNVSRIPLPKIINSLYIDGLCSYDMEFKSSAVGLFEFLHSNPVKNTWSLIQSILQKLHSNLYIEQCKADQHSIDEYIAQKVGKNLVTIKNHTMISPLLAYDHLYINGIKYQNLGLLEKYLSPDFLSKLFSNDKYCEIHGDLTIENIICDYDANSLEKYYIIDPNDGNIHNSPYLDYGKLFQSLHGGYEFLMMTQKISVRGDKIDFLVTKSEAYSELYKKLYGYLKDTYGTEGLNSILFHEIVHWLRLIPYKLNKIGERSLIFYSGFIVVMNDIVNQHFDSDSENC